MSLTIVWTPTMLQLIVVDEYWRNTHVISRTSSADVICNEETSQASFFFFYTQTIQNNSSDNEIRLLSVQPSGVFYFVHMSIFKSCVHWFGHRRAGKHQYSICCRTHTTYVQFIDFIGGILAKNISPATYMGFVRAAGLNRTAKCASMKPVPLARRG